MAAPTYPPNLTKVMKSVERALRKITLANGNYTRGLIVLRGRDPTSVQAESDFADSFLDLGAAAGIMISKEDENPPRTGRTRRWKHTYPVMCLRELQAAERDAGKTLDDVVAELYDDLRTELETAKVLAAAEELGYSHVPSAPNYISCFDHHVTGMMTDEAVSWPMCKFVAIVTFEYDRRTGS
jgi:hypothetical protein